MSHMRRATGNIACQDCGSLTSTPRKGLCFACYQRQLRGTALPAGAICAHCGDRRRPVLRWSSIGQARAVLCGNCVLLARRLKPRPASAEELLQRLGRETWTEDEREGYLLPTSMEVDTDALAREITSKAV